MPVFILAPENARKRMEDAWHYACGHLQEGKRVRLILEDAEEIRTLEQNAAFWPKVNDIAAQVQFEVDGQMVWLEPEEVKEILMAAWLKDRRIARGIDGGHVVLGGSTKRMSKKAFHELTELATHFGDSKGVTWTPPKDQR
jgi:hypothetical protein